ncbi:MarR family winged helix-turn-helix transcriptional regulator [Chelatococcus reniformis]|uniref:MarR family transcriptional regulator n=1 Tax=Chelatococcus reniformis TaxID=1494448 RepID=A0A916TWV2_9HYPH|nr:MarR family winged helix-turn-helix transcriptional regulator [Chelatococcus reniformis]GGC46014.1 MarR family transcriptional regulator [Chelatococcus reniformis]
MSVTNVISPALAEQVARSCLCRRVQRASRSVGRRFDDAFRAVGLTNWQFTMLMALSVQRSRSINEIAAELGMDRTTTTKNLRPLERRGLITIRLDDQDGRVRRVALTQEGNQLLMVAVGAWQAVNDRLAAALTDEQLEALRTALDTISDL